MEPTLQTFLIVCPLVFLAGLVDSVAGGGGLISLPAYLIAGLPPHLATATNKCSSTFGTILTTVRYLKHGHVHIRSAVLSVFFSLFGSWLGAQLNMVLPEQYLYWFLMASLPIIAVFLVFKRDFGSENHMDLLSDKALLVRCALIALVIGVYDGFFGPATGTFLVLGLTGLCHFDLLTASGNAKVMNLASNVAAFVTFAVGGNILWSVGIPAAIFGIAGQYVGSGLALKQGAKVIRPMFLVVMVMLLGTVSYDVAAA